MFSRPQYRHRQGQGLCLCNLNHSMISPVILKAARRFMNRVQVTATLIYLRPRMGKHMHRSPRTCTCCDARQSRRDLAAKCHFQFHNLPIPNRYILHPYPRAYEALTMCKWNLWQNSGVWSLCTFTAKSSRRFMSRHLSKSLRASQSSKLHFQRRDRLTHITQNTRLLKLRSLKGPLHHGHNPHN